MANDTTSARFSPISRCPPAHSLDVLVPCSETRAPKALAMNTTNNHKQIEDLQESLSKLALENEELKYELKQMSKDFEELRNENQRLQQTILEKDSLQVKMGEQLQFVTETAYTLYMKFRAFKCRYYESQRDQAWLGCADEK